MKIAGIVLAVLTGAGVAYGGESSDLLILPETPPTIERLKYPPLDRPAMKKQFFVAETDIDLPRVLPGAPFLPPATEEPAVVVGFYRGSYAATDAFLACVSSVTGRLFFSGSASAGESPRLAHEAYAVSYTWSSLLPSALAADAMISLTEGSRWDQRYTRYVVHPRVAWYSSSTMKASAAVQWESARIHGGGSNDDIAGLMSLQWQPSEMQSLAITAEPVLVTAFDDRDSLLTLGTRYTAALLPAVVVGLGSRWQDGHLYPEGSISWYMMRRLSMAIEYAPGIDVPSWASLYCSSRYVLVNPSLRFPERTFSLTERLIYAQADDLTAELSFQQRSWRDYTIWEHLPGTAFMMPQSKPEAWTADWRLRVKRSGTMLTPALSISGTAPGDIPLIPPYTVDADLEYRVGAWTFGSTGQYVAARRYSTTSTAELAAYTAAAVSVTCFLPQGLEITAGADNILGASIEVQPGFTRTEPEFRAGVTAHF